MKRKILISLVVFFLLGTLLTLMWGNFARQNQLINSSLKNMTNHLKALGEIGPIAGDGKVSLRLTNRGIPTYFINKEGVLPKELTAQDRSLLEKENFKMARSSGMKVDYHAPFSKVRGIIPYKEGYLVSVASVDQIQPMSSFMDSQEIPLLFLHGALAALGAYLISKYLFRGLHEFINASGQISSGELTSRLQVHGRDPELQELSRHFNHMADRLESSVMDSLGNQTQLEAILGSMNSGVIAVDDHDHIIIFNPFARKIFGVFNEAIGKNIHEVIKSTDVDRLLKESDHYEELELNRAISSAVRYRTTEIVTEGKSEKGKVIVIQDITDLKKLEQMRSQFVANVSHELKTPLTSIKGFAEILRDVDDPATRTKFLDIIDQEAERLRLLIEDILTLASIENSERVSMDMVNTERETLGALKLLEVQAKAKNIRLTLLVRGNPRFVGDAGNWRQMVINLTDNAIKYTELNGRISLRLEEEEEKIRLTLADTGTGIPKEHLPRLFERFYRVDKSRDRAKGGTGLGLAIVKHIVLSFKGTIDVDSELGKGTTFTVTFPAYRENGESSQKEIKTYHLGQ